RPAPEPAAPSGLPAQGPYKSTFGIDPRRGPRLVAAPGDALTWSSPAEAVGASASRAPSSQARVVHFSIMRCLMFDLSPVWKWLRGRGKRRATRPPARPRPRPAGARLSLESLEDRNLLSASFAAPVSFPTGAGPESVIVGDF